MFGKPKTVKQSVANGKAALVKLGPNPDHESAQFKQFQLAHYGQWVSVSEIDLLVCLMER